MKPKSKQPGRASGLRALACLIVVALGQTAQAQTPLTQAERLLPQNQIRIANGGWYDHATIWPATGDVLGPLIQTQGPHRAGFGNAAVEADVIFDPGTIAQMGARGENRVSMPGLDGSSLELIFFHCDYRDEGDCTWFGKIAGIAVSEVILSRKGEAFAMVVRDHASPRTWTLDPAGPGAHRLRLLRSHGSRGQCACGEPGTDGGLPLTRLETSLGSSTQRSSLAPADPAEQVDVLFVFTRQAWAQAGSLSGAQAISQNMTADFNTRAMNSTSTLRLRIADVFYLFNYDEDSSGSVDLDRLRTAGDGILDDVQADRNLKSSDLVAMVRRDAWNGVCSMGSRTLGVARRPRSIASLQIDSQNFSVTSLCSDYGATFSHEIGHNLGAQHDIAQGATNSTITSSPHGKLVTCPVIGGCRWWSTTMSYDSDCANGQGSGLPYFSRENLYLNTGLSCGNVPLWDTVSQVEGLIFTSQFTVAQRRLSTSNVWARAGDTGLENGLFYSPHSTLGEAVAAVAGGPDEGTIRAFSGDYQETGAIGGVPVVFNRGCKIVPHGGVVTIR